MAQVNTELFDYSQISISCECVGDMIFVLPRFSRRELRRMVTISETPAPTIPDKTRTLATTPASVSVVKRYYEISANGHLKNT